MTLSQGSQQCLQYIGAVRGYSAATLANYDRTHRQFIAFLVARGRIDDPKHFTVETVMEFCSHLGSLKIHANTILNKIHGLSTLARYLMKQTTGRGRPVLASNPTLGFERPREVRPATKFLLPDELAKFLAVPLDPATALARELLVDTGIRCMEACEANVGDLRQLGDAWYVTLQVKGRRQAGGEPASIPLSADCAARVVAAVQARGPQSPTAPLLLTPRSKKRWTRTQLTQAMIRVGRRAGLTRLTSSPHKLRHTANVVARMSGVDALTRASMLNHRSLRTLARYDHLVAGETMKGREQQRAGLARYIGQSVSGAVSAGCDSPLRLAPSGVASKSSD